MRSFISLRPTLFVILWLSKILFRNISIIKIQKKKLTTNVYTKLYPTGSLPGKFYDAAKVHKRSINDPVEELPLRRITSNVNTATYQLARYLTNIWSPLKS